jgi:hypothetical protein
LIHFAQNVADVSLLPIVVDSGYYSGFVAADIEDSELIGSAQKRWQLEPPCSDSSAIRRPALGV